MFTTKEVGVDMKMKVFISIWFSLFRKVKRDYCSDLDPSCITDNKKFWKSVKPLFLYQVESTESLILVDRNEICYDDTKLSNIFNDFFSNAVKNLNIEETNVRVNESSNYADPKIHATKKYENHPSILKIRVFFMIFTHSLLYNPRLRTYVKKLSL